LTAPIDRTQILSAAPNSVFLAVRWLAGLDLSLPADTSYPTAPVSTLVSLLAATFPVPAEELQKGIGGTHFSLDQLVDLLQSYRTSDGSSSSDAQRPSLAALPSYSEETISRRTWRRWCVRAAAATGMGVSSGIIGMFIGFMVSVIRASLEPHKIAWHHIFLPPLLAVLAQGFTRVDLLAEGLFWGWLCGFGLGLLNGIRIVDPDLHTGTVLGAFLQGLFTPRAWVQMQRRRRQSLRWTTQRLDILKLEQHRV